uniref:Uncharacterized protein n=1 Tax=Meloidogyne floridensis TaxID=298350 RepID=A0A915P6H7_9BILA
MNQQEDDCLNNSSCNNNVVVNNELGRQEWLCNYRVLPSVEPIHIGAHFRGAQTLAMIRIRNYSGSRIHALRGVRNLRIWLDNFCIFYGEICCAVGNSTTGDTILFTTNEEILAKIAEHDEQILQIPEQQQQDSLGDNSQQNLSVLAALQQAGFAAAGRMER